MKRDDWDKRLPLDDHGLAVLGAALHLGDFGRNGWPRPDVADLAYVGALEQEALKLGASIPVNGFRYEWHHLFKHRHSLIPWLKEGLPPDLGGGVDRHVPISELPDARAVAALLSLFVEGVRCLRNDHGGVFQAWLPIPRDPDEEWTFRLSNHELFGPAVSSGRPGYDDDAWLAACLAHSVHVLTDGRLTHYQAAKVVLCGFSIEALHTESVFRPYCIFVSGDKAASHENIARDRICDLASKKVSTDDVFEVVRPVHAGPDRARAIVCLPFVLMNSDATGAKRFAAEFSALPSDLEVPLDRLLRPKLLHG